MNLRPPFDRWLLALALCAWLFVPARAGHAEEAAPAAKPAQQAAAEEPVNEAEEEKKDAEDDKRRAKEAAEAKKWKGKTKEEVEEAEAAQARVMGRRTNRFLTKASTLTAEEKFDESNAVLGRLNPKRLTPYERALVYKYQAYNAFGKEQVPTAISLLRAALAEKILKKSDAADLLFQIARMQMTTGDLEGAVASLNKWFEDAEKPSAAAYFALAICYYQLKDLDKALEPAKKAVEVAETPDPNWIQLLYAIYLTKQDYAAATPVLVQLITRNPDIGKNYWVQLATLYGVQKDIPRALAVMQLAHRRKMIDDDSGVRRLASLLQSEDIPIRSVHVLEQGFAQKQLKEEESTYELLGNSWILARETDKAEPALQKAADLSAKGALYVRLGQVRLLKEDYNGALTAFKGGLAKGGLDDPGSVEMLVGITYYNSGKPGEAVNWFQKSRRSEKARPTAEAWLKHIEEELQKQQNGEAGSVGM